MFRWTPVVAACAVALLSLSAQAAAGVDPTPSIAWQVASSDAEIDRAFALARESGKPVFVYWGAVWCPPCNQVKATLFSRADFVERTRTFIPVYVDGDKPGAQKVAARFKVTGYPTMVLLTPAGAEITRLPGEVDPERYLLALSAGLQAQVPVKELARRALAHERLTPEQWRLLAFYSWDTDEEQVFKSAELASRLSQLAGAAPTAEGISDRLALKAIEVRADADRPPAASVRSADLAFVERLLSDDGRSRDQRDFVMSYAGPMVKYLVASRDGRGALAAKWDAALDRLVAGAPLSAASRVDAIDARVDLWKAGAPDGELPAARRPQVASDIARIVAATTDRYERQAVVPEAAHVLASAGLLDASDELLKSELPRAVAPYYHMLGLASNAKKRGAKADALRWYEQAWRSSEGPATRLQWGSAYVRELVALSPADTGRISTAAHAVVDGLEPAGETFFERNQRSLVKMAAQLLKWQGRDPGRTKVVAQVRSQLAATCAKVPAKDAGRANCDRVFAAAAAKDAS